MARRPIDYTGQMQAAEDRRRQQEAKQRKEELRERHLRERQALSYGQVALAILGDRTTIDEIAGRLLDSRDQGTANPNLRTEWAARGAAYFQPNGSGNGHGKTGTSNGAPDNGEHNDGHEPPAPPSPRIQPAPAPGTQDLLGGIAADRPGAGTAGEGRGRGEQP